jgi:16S rRNA (cytosine967-C5)-methyltransferase
MMAAPQARERPAWAWWGRGAPDLRVRHAVRILRQASLLEELVYAKGPPLDRALRQYQKENRKMGQQDRLVLGESVYHLARNREVFRAALPDAIPGDGQHLLLALLDAWGDEPGKLPHLPEGALPWVRALERVNALRERSVATLTAAHEGPSRGAPAATRTAFELLFSLPAWWLDGGPWQTLEEALRELGRLKRPQHLALRAQAHRASPEAVVGALRDLGIPSRPTPRSPWGVRVEGRHNVLGSSVYREGLVEVQDEGSQLVVCACDPKPSERVLDFCAGGGGKSLALAAALGGRGAVIAHDADRARLADTRRRARRAGLGNIRVVPDPVEVEGLAPFDLVLVDAPCSSSGTLRRNPDVAWRWDEEALARLALLQGEILDRAATLVRQGGLLVYATCSLMQAENQDQVAAFLGRHPGYRPAPLGERTLHRCLLDIPGAGEGAVRLPANLPRYDGDAFFFARLIREG